MTSFFRQYDILLQSNWFDADFYLKDNPEIALQSGDPVLHYLEVGARLGLRPHPDFDVDYYRAQCASLGISVDNPLLHYLEEGAPKLGLKPNGAAASRDAVDERERVLQPLLESGLFDLAFYRAAYGLQFDDEAAALRHFLFEGSAQGKRPNLYFDPLWYLKQYPELTAAVACPLFHFHAEGDAQGQRPSVIFDSVWYREHYQVASDDNSLAHYLRNCRSGRHSPIPEFDVEYYCTVNKDVRDAAVDPFQHYLFTGYREGRNPSPQFNVRYYAKRYLGGDLRVNPLLHYLAHKHEPGIHGIPPEDEPSVPRAVRQFSAPAADFEAFKPLPAALPRKAKLLAYYLPQFHAFAENDAWWGAGFTEWTNVARGVSRFKGHYQPRIPRDLGFYSLDDALPTLRRQIELAKGGGIYGFVFYYYWFNGRRLMERPIEQFLTEPDLDLPFALMWANENWTRRWDGDEHEVLISQDYDPADDERLIADFVRHFRDPRYIRVQGRPLLMIYRPGIIPRAAEVLARWRSLFRERFGEEPVIVMVQAFGDTDPGTFGFDGAIEFPPHKLTANMPSINDDLVYVDEEFTGKVFSYDDVVARSLSEPIPTFPQIKTAAPGWDNDARRQGAGLVIHGSTPAKFENWLKQLIERARRAPFFGEHFVCINAWNEWCEAAYLEPDLHYGGAYLNAVGRAVAGVSAAGSQGKLLLVGHDAFPSGAQQLLLNIARQLKAAHGLHVEFLLLGGGTLEGTYKDVAPVTLASGDGALRAALASMQRRGIAHAIVNTVAAATVLPRLREHGIEAVTLVHEMPRIVHEKSLQAGARLAFEASRATVVATPVVRDQLAQALQLRPDQRVRIIPQGLYRRPESSADAVAALRRELRIGDGEKLVLGIGYADLRKGFDLFLQLWRCINEGRARRAHFCWLGGIDPGLRHWLGPEIEAACAAGSFHMPGHRQTVAPYLLAADAFALTSREDPFPTVVHEALSVGLPVFAFADAGGMSDFLAEHDMGFIVPHADVLAMAARIEELLVRPFDELAAGRRKAFVSAKLDFGDYVRQLLRLALPQSPSISVAIPNYNYAKFLPGRLATVFQQQLPVDEILLLDDGSSDNSLEVVSRVASEWERSVTVLPNAINSGSPFAQWRKAAETAKGDFLWLAEADDLSEPTFLSAVVGAMQSDPAICIGFSDSRSIDSDGALLSDSYQDYYARHEPGALSSTQVFDGSTFARRYLSVRNLILNASAVVWRRAALLKALDACAGELRGLRMAGDWRLYLELLGMPGARIAYVAEPVNIHRRHSQSVTHALPAQVHLAEIAHCHQAAMKFELPKKLVGAQKKYIAEIATQLLARCADEGASISTPTRKLRGR